MYATVGDKYNRCLLRNPPPLHSPQMVQSVLRGQDTHQTCALIAVDKAYQCVPTSGQGGSSVLVYSNN